MRVNFRGTKLSRIADFQIFAVFIFADAGVTNIILDVRKAQYSRDSESLY